MRRRTFGRAGWQVGELGYGMWGMANWSGTDDAESLGSLQLAAYHPGDLLRFYLYGYLHRLRSSRKREQETHRSVDLIWLPSFSLSGL